VLADPERMELRLCDGCKHVCYEEGRLCCEGCGEWEGRWFCRKCWAKWEPNSVPELPPAVPSYSTQSAFYHNGFAHAGDAAAAAWWSSSNYPFPWFPPMSGMMPPPAMPGLCSAPWACGPATGSGPFSPFAQCGFASAEGGPLGNSASSGRSAGGDGKLADPVAALFARAEEVTLPPMPDRHTRAALLEPAIAGRGACSATSAPGVLVSSRLLLASKGPPSEPPSPQSASGSSQAMQSKILVSPVGDAVDDHALDGTPLVQLVTLATDSNDGATPPPQRKPPPPPERPPPPPQVPPPPSPWSMTQPEGEKQSPASGSSSLANNSCQAVSMEEHPLICTWFLWLLMDRGVAWEQAQQKVHGPISSVEAFWQLIRHIHPPSSLCDADYSFFRDHTKPAREDPHMQDGGRWILALTTGGQTQARGYVVEAQFAGLVDRVWRDLLLALIGERFESACGAVISLRERSASNCSAKLSLWLCNADSREDAYAAGQVLQELLARATGELDPPKGGWRLAFEDFRARAVTIRI